jgi:hypothetical protein
LGRRSKIDGVYGVYSYKRGFSVTGVIIAAVVGFLAQTINPWGKRLREGEEERREGLRKREAGDKAGASS